MLTSLVNNSDILIVQGTVQTPIFIKYYSLTNNTSRNYFLKKEGFFKSFVVLVLGRRKLEKNEGKEEK